MANLDPYTVMSSGLKAIFDAEFASEAVTLEHDKLHEALGSDNAYAGIYPVESRWGAGRGGGVMLEHFAIIQYYDFWDKQIDPAQTVDPRDITAKATRLMRAIQINTASPAGSPEVWYYNVIYVSYPDDPTGNKTRFHMTVRGYGDNLAILETR